MERPAIDIAALDEQVGERAGGTELAVLRPQAALQDGGMEVEHSFPLDERVGVDRVAPAGREAISLSAPSSVSVSAIPLCRSCTSTMILTGTFFEGLIAGILRGEAAEGCS